jgi:phosphatidylserine decarboxylase
MSEAVAADIEACVEELEDSRIVKWFERVGLKTIVMIEEAREMAAKEMVAKEMVAKEMARKRSTACRFFLTSLPPGVRPHAKKEMLPQKVG